MVPRNHPTTGVHVDLDDGLHTGDVGPGEPHPKGGIEDLLHLFKVARSKNECVQRVADVA